MRSNQDNNESSTYRLPALLLALFLVVLGSVPVFAGSSALYTLQKDDYKKTSYTYTGYDVTGDGKADTLQLLYGGYDGNFYRKLTVKINGKKALTFRSQYGYYEVDAQIVKLSNGKVYLFLVDTGEDDSAELCAFYCYSGGKLKKAFDCLKMVKSQTVSWGDHTAKSLSGLKSRVTRVKGNTIYIESSGQFQTTAWIRMAFKLKPKSNGNLARTSKKGTITGEKGSKYWKLLSSVKAYKSATSRKVKMTLKKGTRVKITHMYYGDKYVRLRVKTSSGKVGWISMFLQRKIAQQGSYGTYYLYAPVFDGMGYAG